MKKMKKGWGALYFAFAVAGFVFSGGAVKAAGVDGPMLTAFSIDKTSVNTTSQAQTVKATLSVSDSSGVDINKSSDCYLRSITTWHSYYGKLISNGSDQYTCEFTLPVYAPTGQYYFDFRFYDTVGNSSSYLSNLIEGRADENYPSNSINAWFSGAVATTVYNMATNQDVTPPRLVDFSADPINVNTTSQDQTVTATLTVLDDQSGVLLLDDGDGSICKLNSMDTIQSQSPQYLNGVLVRTSGNQYSCEVIMKKGSATGRWQFGLDLRDNMGNNVGYYTSADILSVVSNAIGTVITNDAKIADVTGPVITSFSANPASVDTSSSQQAITATYSVTDSSGVDNYSTCDIFSPSSNQYYHGQVSNVGDQYTCVINLPVGSAKGDWMFTLNFWDTFNNSSRYDARYIGGDNNMRLANWPEVHNGAIINNAAVASDETGPTLITFSATPTEVNTDTHSQTIIATFNTSEPLTLNYGSTCELLGNGQGSVIDIKNVSGNQYTCKFILPTNSASGRWDFNLYLRDILGNATSYQSNPLNGNGILKALPIATGAFITNRGTSTVRQINMNASGSGAVNPISTEMVITNPVQAATVAVDSGVINPTVNVSTFIDDQGTGILPQITIGSAVANVAIPSQTTVSADPSWNGIISAPTATIMDLPVVPGETRMVSAAIEVGSINTNLSFDKAVRILLPGQAGKLVGFKKIDGVFTEITNVCSADNQEAGNALASEGNCKINVDGDLVIWTKHFTQFGTYSQSQNEVTAPTISLASVPTAVTTESKVIEDENGIVTGFSTANRTPISVTLTKGSADYSNVRIVVAGLNDGVQLIAQDITGTWYNIAKTGWGPAAGFNIATVTTPVYLVANTAGLYTATINLVDVSNGNAVLASATASVTAEDPADTVAPTMEPATVVGKTITYTFSEPMQLVKQSENATERIVTDFNQDLLGIYSVDAQGNYGPRENVTISAILNSNVLAITYTGNLEKQADTYYVIDAWGFDITDLAGNKIPKEELSKALFEVKAAVIIPNSYTLAADVEGSPMLNHPAIETTPAGDEAGHTYVAGDASKFATGYAKVAVTKFEKTGTLANNEAATIKVAGSIDGLQLFGNAENVWWDITKGGWGDGSMTVDQALALTGNSGTFYAAGTPGTYTFKLQMFAGSVKIAETADLKVVITAPKVDQAAPTGLEGVAPTTADNNDGKIIKTTTAMEYKLSTGATYVKVTNAEITGLAAGIYDVRFSAATGFNAGEVATVLVASYVAPVADLTAYDAVLGKVTQANYTPESWTIYQKVVLDNVVTTANTQAQIDAATSAIKAAQGSLILTSDIVVTPPVVTPPADLGNDNNNNNNDNGSHHKSAAERKKEERKRNHHNGGGNGNKVSQATVQKKIAEFSAFTNPQSKAAFNVVSSIKRTNPAKFRAIESVFKKYNTVSGRLKVQPSAQTLSVINQYRSYDGYSKYLNYAAKLKK